MWEKQKMCMVGGTKVWLFLRRIQFAEMKENYFKTELSKALYDSAVYQVIEENTRYVVVEE